MPAIPFVVAAVAAAGSTAAAAGTAVAAGAAVAGTAVAAGAATAVTVGGLSITVGQVLVAVTALGISKAVFDDLNSGASDYLSEDEKNAEKEKLQANLDKEIKWLKAIKENEENPAQLDEINDLIQKVNKSRIENSFYNAINTILRFKLIYAERENDKPLAQNAESIGQRLLNVRKETKRLR